MKVSWKFLNRFLLSY